MTLTGSSGGSAGSSNCTRTYKVVRGDYWIRIARNARIPLKDVLAANRATATTPLFAGRTICLTGVAAAATPSSTTPATTAPPSTTAPPMPAVAPIRTYTREQVIAIIREVWPDELEEEAIRIATRESTLVPTARNYCCHGLFQIYFNVHKGWLAGMGVTSIDQLYDPLINARAAKALYDRAGGWGPWR